MSHILTAADLLLHPLEVTHKHTNAIVKNLMSPHLEDFDKLSQEMLTYCFEHLQDRDYLVSTSRTYERWYSILEDRANLQCTNLGFWDISHLGFLSLQRTKTSFQLTYHTMIPEVWDRRYEAYRLQQKSIGYSE